jgi:hypothetical protein
VTGKFSLLMHVILPIIFHSCKLFSKEKKKEKKKRKKKKENKRGHKRKWIKSP